MPIAIPRTKPPSERSLSAKGLRLIKEEEGFQGVAYKDEGGVWTIGYGSTTDVHQGMVISEADAEMRLFAETTEAQDIVRAKVRQPITQDWFDALTSHAFNEGRIPPSMLACINGGVTDKGVQMEPGSWKAASEQFPRNCRVRMVQHDLNPPIKLLVPRKGNYIRCMKEALCALGFEWDEAVSGVKLATIREQGPSGEWRYVIDEAGTTPLSTVLQRAHLAASVEGLPPEPEVEDEEIFEPAPTPASPAPVSEETAAPRAEQGETPKPPPHDSPMAAGEQVEGPAPIPAPAPQAAPVSPQPQAKVEQTTVQTTAVTVGPVPPTPAPIKDILTSKRGWGTILNTGGHIITVGGVTAPFGLGPAMIKFGKAYGAVINDPVTLELACGAAVFTSGWILVHLGGWIKRWGEHTAKAPLGTDHEVRVAKAVVA